MLLVQVLWIPAHGFRRGRLCAGMTGCLEEFGFLAKQIPGSINLTDPKAAKSLLHPEDDIVVYCSDEGCAASKYAYYVLTRAGYPNVRRYAGGIADWEESGYPLEGEWVDEGATVS